MKKQISLIVLFTCLLLSLQVIGKSGNQKSIKNLLYAETLTVVRFILPEGHPYKNIGLFSGINNKILLKFGDSVTVKDESLHGSITWYHCSLDNFSFYLPDVFVVKEPESIRYDENGNIQIGEEVVNMWTALPIHYKPDDLIRVGAKYLAESSKNRAIFLREKAASQFMLLIDAAEKDGINIRIVSAYRDPGYQSYLYEDAIKRKGFFQSTVAKPGHSEHHLGTTCDLTSDEISTGLTSDFEYTRAFQWLKDNIHYYGIYLSYPKYKTDITGYEYEPWHFRYWGNDRWESDRWFYRSFIRR
ncbi:MAG TPA: D-alanyl-D-alanine carboxypeptidase family protein [Spirochaetes bacterium]|nr:D-alanyl-D-alanine carboxypeptidase family protein [Spirochaetota bacterium]